MRTRLTPIKRLLAAALLVGGLVVAVAQPAFAEDPGKKSGKELVECVESALTNNDATIKKGDYKPFTNALDDCRKAKSLLTPALSEMIWGIIAFAIVAFVLMRFGFPAIKKVIKNREDKIRDDLESAERSRLEAERLAEEHRVELAGARGEANRIIEEARVAAEAVRRERIAAAEAEAAEVRTRAAEDIRLASQRAMSDLSGRVAELSIELAEKVVERNLDRETQSALIESYINQVGSN
jgi:F-type H+-transporting ATPase subunit b